MMSWITSALDSGLNLANYFPVTSGVELLPGLTNIGTISRGIGRVDVHSGLQRWDKSDRYHPGSSRDREARALMPEKWRKRMNDEDVRDGNKPKPTRQASRPHKQRRIPLTTEVSGWDSELFAQPLRLRAGFRDLSPTI